MARTTSYPVFDSKGKRVKNLSYRDTAKGRVYDHTTYVAGKPKRNPLPLGTSKEDAIRYVRNADKREAVAKIEGKVLAQAERLADVADTYFKLTEEYIKRARRLGPDPSYKGVTSLRTLDTYRGNYSNYIEPYFKGKTWMHEITGPKVTMFYRWLRTQPGRKPGSTLTEGTVNSIRSTLRGIVTEARNMRAMTTDPLAEVLLRDRPRPGQTDPDYVRVTVRPEQLLATVANAAKGDHRALVTVGVLTGMRASEIDRKSVV